MRSAWLAVYFALSGAVLAQGGDIGLVDLWSGDVSYTPATGSPRKKSTLVLAQASTAPRVSDATVRVLKASLVNRVSAFGGPNTGWGGDAVPGRLWLRVDVSIESSQKPPASLPIWPLGEVILYDDSANKYGAVGLTAVDESFGSLFCFFQDILRACGSIAARASDGSLVGVVLGEPKTAFLVTPPKSDQQAGVVWGVHGAWKGTFRFLFDVPRECRKFQLSLWGFPRAEFVATVGTE